MLRMVPLPRKTWGGTGPRPPAERRFGPPAGRLFAAFAFAAGGAFPRPGLRLRAAAPAEQRVGRIVADRAAGHAHLLARRAADDDVARHIVVVAFALHVDFDHFAPLRQPLADHALHLQEERLVDGVDAGPVEIGARGAARHAVHPPRLARIAANHRMTGHAVLVLRREAHLLDGALIGQLLAYRLFEAVRFADDIAAGQDEQARHCQSLRLHDASPPISGRSDFTACWVRTSSGGGDRAARRSAPQAVGQR